MIDLSTISTALETQLNANLPSTDAGKTYTVERGERVNASPEAAPWVGIYINEAESDPGRTGSGTGASLWTSLVTIRLVIQAADWGSGAACEDLLGEYIKDVWDAIETDRRLAGTVDMLVGYKVERQFVDTADEAVHFQQAIMIINARKVT